MYNKKNSPEGMTMSADDKDLKQQAPETEGYACALMRRPASDVHLMPKEPWLRRQRRRRTSRVWARLASANS